jgi:type IV secretory pathway TraG/TraD family ATPase VirD4
LSVANDPILSDVFSPIIALIAMVCIKNMNQQGKHPSIFILDEAPTLFIPGLANLPATARSNQVVSVIAVQDFAQLQSIYGNKAAETIRNNLANQFFGMTNNLGTAEYVSKMAGFYHQMRTSVSDSSGPQGSSSSQTASLHKEQYVDAHQVASQPSGHFITKVTGKSPQFFETQLKALKLSMKPPDPIMSETRLSTLVDDQWKTIHREVQRII